MTQYITGRESRREYSVKPQGMLVALLPIIDYNISVNIVVYNSRNGMLFVNKDAVMNAKKLEEIGKLPYDWNGYEAKPFTTALIDKCEKIISVLNHQPQIYPTGRQSIQFQYELADRSYLEFEIFEDKTMCLCVPKRIYANAKEMKIVDSEAAKIKEIVENFYGSNGTAG